MEVQKIDQNGLTVQQTNSLTTYLQGIPDYAPEKKILEVKYSARPFVKMSVAEILDCTKVSMLKIFVITGWEIPSGDIRTILIDQLSKHLKESYSLVNINEVEFAFRQYGSSVKDWGKSMNLVLFDQVMTQYMRARWEASEAERNRPVDLPKLEGPKKTDEEKVEIAKGLYQMMGKVDLIYPESFQALVNLGEIKYPMAKEVQLKYMQIAEQRMKEYDRQEPGFFKNRDRVEWRKIYARKLVVADYFDGKL